ncbi:Hsp20 family protein [Halobellus sp. GM3]|uniref:Hsp20 family protein n=1 Tax=Halobellus sp. GM3 TaxID=3458410 RepID=UPI00403DA0A6
MMKRSPSFDEFDDLFARMSRQLEEMSRQFDAPRPFGHETAIDLREDSESFVAVVDLPGFDREDIDLSVADRLLTIEAVREESTDTGNEHGSEEHYVRRERRSDSVRRSLRLPADVRADDASATYNNGVLTVILPKLLVEDDEASHHIDVE